jgi:hypothetical protein
VWSGELGNIIKMECKIYYNKVEVEEKKEIKRVVRCKCKKV